MPGLRREERDRSVGSDGAERERLLRPLLDDVDGLAAKGVAAMQAELPAYATQSGQFFEDVVDQIRRNYTALLQSLIEDRPLSAGELAFQRGASMRRARAGFALEDYLSAYRVGQQVTAHSGGVDRADRPPRLRPRSGACG